MTDKQKKQTSKDENLRDDILTALYKAHLVDSSHIKIEVNDGLVFLEGTVSKKEDIRGAQECVSKLYGVSEIRNHLKVRSPDDGPLIKPGFETGFS